MRIGIAPPGAGETAQIFGGDGGLVGEQDEHAIGGSGRVREAFANRTGDAFRPFAIHGHGHGAVLEQGRQLAGVRAQHHGHGMSGEFDGTAHDGVQQRTAVDAHQLLGGTEAGGCARRQHHDVDMAGIGGRGIHGSQRRVRNPIATTETTQMPAIMAVLPATSAKAERG